MPQAYSNPARESDPHALPDVEYFHAKASQCDECGFVALDGGDSCECDTPQWVPVPGWFYWYCFPGCIPDGEPNGPFATEAECIADFQDGMKEAMFERFDILMPGDAVRDCSHSGACDDDVAYWAPRIERPDRCTPEALRAELKEYGAWDAAELDDDAQNWQRIVWLAAGNISARDAENA